MATILTLVRKDIANFLRNRAALSLTFLVPVALIYIFGQVFGLNRKERGPSNIALGVVNELPDSPLARKLVEALKAEKTFHVIDTTQTAGGNSHPLTEAEARQEINDRHYNFALVIPKDIIPDGDLGLHLKVLNNPRNEIETQTVNGLLQKTIFSNVPDLLGQSLQARAKKFLGDNRLKQFNGTMADAIAGAFGGDPAEIQREIESGNFGLTRVASANPKPATAPEPNLRRLDTPPPAEPGRDPAKKAKQSDGNDVFSRLVRIENVQIVGKDVKSPDATRIVGGYAIMFLLFAVSGGSAAFFDEKNAGLFQRLLSSPVSRAQLLTSRFLFSVLLGFIQLVTLYIGGSLMYGIDIVGHAGNLLLVCTAAAAACASFGMFIAAVAPNAGAAQGLATFIVMVMSATGGAWFPMSMMPEFMQKIGHLSIVYWAMEGFLQVLWAGDTLLQLLPTVGILFAITAGVMAVAIWRLNHKSIFE